MKFNFLLAIFFSFNSLSHAQDEAGGAKIVINDEESSILPKLTQTEILKVYTEKDEEVIAAMEKCKTDQPNKDVMDCLWDDDGLTAEKKEEIYKALEIAKDNEEVNYQAPVANYKTEDSAAIKTLEAYMQKKLEEALYDDDKGKIKPVDDHTIFLKLYKSQLGKNLINQVSAFCIYADPNGTGYVPAPSEGKKLAFYKETNLANLGKVGVISQKTGEEGSSAFIGFSACIGNIGNLCRKDFRANGNELQFVEANHPNIKEESLPVSACEVNKMMTSIKSAIAATDELVEGFEDLNEGNKNNSLLPENMSTKKIDTNSIVNIGSKELIEDSGYKGKLEDLSNEIKEKCSDPANLTSEECKKYFTSAEDNEKLKLEADFRNKALAAKVEEDVEAANGDVEGLRKIFKSQGLSDEEFDKLVESAANNQNGDTPFDYLKKKITAQYNNERDQLRKSLNDKLELTKVDYQDETKNTAGTADKLAQHYLDSAENLAQVYQYANIVSSFIEVEKGGEKTRNSSALAAELDSNYFEADPSGNRGVASSSGTSFDDLRGFSGGSQSSSGDAAFEETNLSVEEINKMQWDGLDEPSTP